MCHAIPLITFHTILYMINYIMPCAQVLLAKRKADGDIYAVKVLQKAHIMKRNEAKHIMSERNVLLKSVKHPFLVGLHYSFQTRDRLYFVLDYVNGGEVSRRHANDLELQGMFQ